MKYLNILFYDVGIEEALDGKIYFVASNYIFFD